MAEQVNGTVTGNPDIQGQLSGAPAVSNYEKLGNKPKINGVELIGDVSFEELGLLDIIVARSDLENLQKDVEQDMTELQKAVGQDVSELQKAMEQDMTELQKAVGQDMTELQQTVEQELEELQKALDNLVDGNEVAY